MAVKNATKNAILEVDFKLCEDLRSKSVGLMFSKKRKIALIFKFKKEKIIALHMLFVFYPIDAVFLDKGKRVVDMKKNFRPFAFYKSKKKAMYCIELPQGSIIKANTEIGDKIRWGC